MSALLPPLLLALAPCSSHFEFGVGEVALKICALTWRIFSSFKYQNLMIIDEIPPAVFQEFFIEIKLIIIKIEK